MLCPNTAARSGGRAGRGFGSVSVTATSRCSAVLTVGDSRQVIRWNGETGEGAWKL